MEPRSLNLPAAAIIPLGPGSHQDSSSLPEGPNELGSSPLLFGLAPRGVYRASDVATGAVGSYPTVSPLPSIAAFNDPLARTIFKTRQRFSFSRPPRRFAPAVYFLWHFPEPTPRGPLSRTERRVSPLALPGALPFSPTRLLPRTFIQRHSALRTTVSGLSSRPAFLRSPAQRSPGLPAFAYYNLHITRTHPLNQ
jgi:hypothetical protein